MWTLSVNRKEVAPWPKLSPGTFRKVIIIFWMYAELNRVLMYQAILSKINMKHKNRALSVTDTVVWTPVKVLRKPGRWDKKGPRSPPSDWSALQNGQFVPAVIGGCCQAGSWRNPVIVRPMRPVFHTVCFFLYTLPCSFSKFCPCSFSSSRPCSCPHSKLITLLSVHVLLEAIVSEVSYRCSVSSFR